MTFLVLSLISILVIGILSLLDRNERRYYYFGFAIIAGGFALSFWGYSNSSIKVDDYVLKSAQIVSVSRREPEDTLVFETVSGDFLFPGAYLDGETEARLLSTSWAKDEASIWVGSTNSRIIKGIDTPNLKVDPQSIAIVENLQNGKLVIVGFVIVGVGVLVNFFNYLSRRLGGRE